MLVEGEFGDSEVLGPIIMEGMGVAAEDLLDGFVAALSLTISFGVVGGGDVEFGSKGVEDGAPKGGDEARVTI